MKEDDLPPTGRRKTSSRRQVGGRRTPADRPEEDELPPTGRRKTIPRRQVGGRRSPVVVAPPRPPSPPHTRCHMLLFLSIRQYSQLVRYPEFIKLLSLTRLYRCDPILLIVGPSSNESLFIALIARALSYSCSIHNTESTSSDIRAWNTERFSADVVESLTY